MTHYELFEEFIKYHTPRFSEQKNPTFCNGTPCDSCKIHEECSMYTIGIYSPHLSPTAIIKVKENYPEYVI